MKTFMAIGNPPFVCAASGSHVMNIRRMQRRATSCLIPLCDCGSMASTQNRYEYIYKYIGNYTHFMRVVKHKFFVYPLIVEHRRPVRR
jgi:hypothetical protein